MEKEEFIVELANLAMSALTEREATIFLMRYGFHTGKFATLQEIASCIGVSRERIRQILNKCNRKIRSRRRWKNKTCNSFLRLNAFFTKTIKLDENGWETRLIDLCKEYLPQVGSLAQSIFLLDNLLGLPEEVQDILANLPIQTPALSIKIQRKKQINILDQKYIEWPDSISVIKKYPLNFSG